MNEPRQMPTPEFYDDEIDLRALFRVLWNGKWLIGGITLAVTLIAIAVAVMLPNIYRAEALLAPNDKEGASGLSALAAQYGGLASLAGLNLGNKSNDRTSTGIQTLRSRRFISGFIERHEILVPLMAAKGWDRETGELIIDRDKYNPDTKQWIREVSPPKKKIPSSQEAYDQFLSILTIDRDRYEGFVLLSIEHFSPQLAKQWVDYLVDDLNASTMSQEVAEAKRAIDYLNQQIQNTSLAGLQGIFYSLVEEQTKTIMLASVSGEYVFKTLDPAVVPEEKSKPNRAFIILLGAFVGGAMGILSCFTGALIRKWHS